jgi:hypothetical protein
MVRSKLTALDKINLFLNIYGRLAIGVFRLSWWSPFFMLAIFQIFGFYAFLWYYLPGWINFILPLLKLIFSADNFHYPAYYLALPRIYSLFEIAILGPTLWIIFSAAASYRLGHLYDDEKVSIGECFNASVNKYLPLLVVWIFETALVLLILYLPGVILKSQLDGAPNRIMVLRLLLQMVGFGISAMLIYAIPGIILDNKRLFEAIGDSISLFFKNIFLSYFIIFLPNIPRLILNLLLGDLAPRIINLLNPELIPTLLFTSIVLGIFINYYVYGAAVFVYKELSR